MIRETQRRFPLRRGVRKLRLYCARQFVLLSSLDWDRLAVTVDVIDPIFPVPNPNTDAFRYVQHSWQRNTAPIAARSRGEMVRAMTSRASRCQASRWLTVATFGWCEFKRIGNDWQVINDAFSSCDNLNVGVTSLIITWTCNSQIY